MSRKAWSVALLISVGIGCSDGSGSGDGTGNLVFKVSTFGVQLDPNGYAVSFDGELPFAVAINDTIEFKDQDAREVAIAIDGVADNCETNVPSPLTVEIRGGETTDTTLQITCVAIAGSRE